MLILLVRVALAIWVYMTAFFLVASLARRNDLADVAWGLGFVVVAVTAVLAAPGLTARQGAVLLATIIWAARLALHIWSRNRKQAEDFRYRKWREDWGDQYLIKAYLNVFMLQGLFMLINSLPITVVNYADSGGWGITNWIGVLVWAGGLVFEAVGDHQLTVFRNDAANRGKIITTGLWRYTRHPNYFGEALLWWGIWLMTVGSAFWPLGAIGPAFITLMLTRVSGIPLLEKRSATKPGWAEYAARTSVFIPWFPKQ
ncbi:MAG: DUF1295 domain-containing protein [Chloroflexi bacterium]|jgi:steroid 5-alpha reductase family enzyme|nr:DUF1295 domain-containing protein [Chloroflexota bacterium]